MHLNNVLTILKKDLLAINEAFSFTKEPNENDVDIDLLITNRSRQATISHLIKHSLVPLYFTHKNRGFAHYLSQKGFIKAIDLFDAPFVSDATIKWFLSRSYQSDYDSSFNILSHKDQLAFSIYKAIKKDKPKRSRYEKIINLTQFVSINDAQKAISQLFTLQNETSNAMQQAHETVAYIYSTTPSFDIFSDIVRVWNGGKSNAFFMVRVLYRTKCLSKRLSNSLFFIFIRQKKQPILCVVGVDGVGKSSTIDALTASFTKLDFYTTRMETKVYHSVLTKFYMRFCRQYFLNFDLFFIYYDTKEKIKTFFKQATQGKVVIVDRWWSDFFIASKRAFLLDKYPKLLSKFLLLPKPDLLVLIEVPAELSIKRKPEEDLIELSYKKERLSTFMNEHFSHTLLTIKGDDDMENNLKILHRQLYSVWCASLRKKGK